MIRAIRGLAVAGLVAVALAAWMTRAMPVGVYSPQDVVHFLLWPMLAETGTLLSFSAGVLALALTLPRCQRPWAAALLAALFLNGYVDLVFYPVLQLLAGPTRIPAWWLNVLPVVNVVLYGIAPAAPALVALGYTFRAARSAPQATPAIEEQGSLDITIEPIRKA